VAGAQNAVLDGDAGLLATQDVSGKTLAHWQAQLKYARNYAQKMQAIAEVQDDVQQDVVVDGLLAYLKDPSEDVRKSAYLALNSYTGVRRKALLKESIGLILRDPSPSVRTTVVEHFADDSTIAQVKAKGLFPEMAVALNHAVRDSSYKVQAATLALMTYIDPKRSLRLADSLSNSRSASLTYVASAILMAASQPEHIARIMNNVRAIKDTQERYQLIRDFAAYLAQLPEGYQDQGVAMLIEIADDEDKWWLRYAAVDALSGFKTRADVKAFAAKRTAEETNLEVLMMLRAIQ